MSTEPPKLEKKLKHTIEVVVDRLVAKGPASSDTGAKRRLTDSVETALNLAGGVLLIEFVDVDLAHPGAVRERRFSERMACPNDHPIAIDEIEPRSFSFNAPYGACPRCTGIGTELEVDPELLVLDDDLSLGEGAIAPWSQGSGSADYFLRVIAALGEDLRFSMDTPWKAPPEAKEALLYGENYKVHVKYRNRYGRDRSYTTGFEGVVLFVKRRHAETDRLEPGAVRGLHGGGAVPPMPGRPPQARDPRGPRRRQEHLRDLVHSPSTRRPPSSPTSTSRCANGRSPSG